MEDLKPYLTPLAGSPPPGPPSGPGLEAYALQRAAMMFGCFRKGEANDPETYTAGVAAVLAEYDRDVIEYVTDPRTGLPSSTDFHPTIKEVREACGARAKANAMRAKPTYKAVEYRPFRGPPPGQDYFSMFEKHGRPIGRFEEKPLALPKQAAAITSEEAKRAIGATDQQWDEIPDAGDYDFKRLDPLGSSTA
jgi:hypothetical protein